MRVRCPGCGASYGIPVSRLEAGLQRCRCRRCGEVFSLKTSSGSDGVPTKAATAPAKVAIIEDAGFFRALIADVLKPLHLSILIAGDGDSGLELVRRERPALVILDLNLPLRDGFSLIRAIRAEEPLNHCRVLAISGVFRQEHDRRKALEAGADEFMGKSFTPEAMRELVTRMLGGAAGS